MFGIWCLIFFIEILLDRRRLVLLVWNCIIIANLAALEPLRMILVENPVTLSCTLHSEEYCSPSINEPPHLQANEPPNQGITIYHKKRNYHSHNLGVTTAPCKVITTALNQGITTHHRTKELPQPKTKQLTQHLARNYHSPKQRNYHSFKPSTLVQP